MSKYIAVDLGAESGRVMLGTVSGDKLELEEMHRFSNIPVGSGDELRWDFGMLFSEIKTGIAKAVKDAGQEIVGIAVDSWGAGMGLIDDEGKLIENPYHYRVSTVEMIEKAFEFMPKQDIYDNTGLQFMPFNDIYRLLDMHVTNYEPLTRAKHILFIADLFSYHLCGEMFGEYSLASCTQMVNMKSGQWSKEIFEALSLPFDKMPKIVKPGTVVGKLTESVAKELGCGQIPVITVGAHDTASAVAAVPAKSGNWAYLSSGTWSLIGVEVPDAVINDLTFEYEFTNEGGVENTIRLLKNVMGLWLVQQCRSKWAQQGLELSYSQIAGMAGDAKPFAAHINPDCLEFYSTDDMPLAINRHLADTGQEQIDDKGQMIRVILESLAFKYRYVLERMENVTKNKIDVLHIVGGGIKNELLCEFTANATGKKVVAGPVEATAMGNIMMQAIAAGQIKSLQQGRDIVSNSIELKEYMPSDSKLWTKEYEKAREIY